MGCFGIKGRTGGSNSISQCGGERDLGLTFVRVAEAYLPYEELCRRDAANRRFVTLCLGPQTERGRRR